MSITKGYYSLYVYTPDFKPVVPYNDEFALKHNTEYKVMVFNHHPTLRCNASIYIDGKNMGHFRISTRNSITIERPEYAAKRFTFLVPGTKEAEKCINARNPELGVLKVVIETEKVQTPKFGDIVADGGESDDDDMGFCMAQSVDCAPSKRGGTALGTLSSQRFTQASVMEIQPSVTIITGFLVEKNRYLTNELTSL